ncbi:D-alanyl-D-alanine carboxypeptidase family protein [Jannaschia sp. R86511]|uniref:D-alanyl-D-alanine carboxypeptidase family protein n=1 Tax=Jannaschia sp. R86511 TaxID=3093853 RepID=UPI0036D2A24F
MPTPPVSRLLACAAAVALGVGGVVLPAAAAPGAGPALVPVTATAPPAQPCPDRQLPLGPGALEPDAPRAALPEASEAVRGDELAAPGLLVPAGAPAPPAVTATAWLVADLDSGEVLAACNAHLPFAPASTIKVLTALALLPGLDPATVHTAGPASAAAIGSRVGLVQGSQYTVDDLAHGLMLSSGNDAAVALGEVAGGQEVALGRMTQVARGVGAWSTVPRTTNGLDAPGQFSTPHDLAVLARAALAEPRVAGPAATVRYDFPASGRVGDPDRETYEIQTSSRLLRNYDGATGLKSGFTRASGGSYVGTAERDGRRYVATVMRSQGSAWRHSADLLDWAFATGGQAGTVGTLAQPGQAPEDASRSRDGAGGAVGDALPSGAPSGEAAPAPPSAGAPASAAPEPSPAPTTDPLAAITGPGDRPRDAGAAAPGPGPQLLALGVLVVAAVAAAVVVRGRRARGGRPV